MSAQPTIVVSEFMDEAAVDRLREHHPTHYDPKLVDNPVALEQLLSGAKALVVRNRTQVRGHLLDAGENLKIIGRLGVGLDNIDVDACRAKGIEVAPATGANSAAVAEYVIATALLLIRGHGYRASAAVTAGAWPRTSSVGGEVGGKLMGLVGFGGIAREVARRARGLDMQVAAFDPMIEDDDAVWSDPSWGPVKPMSFMDLIAEADFLSLHVPLTDRTRNLIGPAEVERMKPTAIVINTARGGVVDEGAITTALSEERLGGAALDVFATEPVTESSGLLFENVPNLILSPHIAGVTTESNVRVSHMIADKVLAHLNSD